MSIGSEALQLRDVPWTNPIHVANIGGRLISPKVGVIRLVAHGIYRAQDPKCLTLGVAAPNMTPLFGGGYAGKAGGAGENLDHAIAATIGEAVERYCAHFYEAETLTLATYREIGDAAVHPRLLRLISEEQIRNAPAAKGLTYFTENTRTRWVKGYSLTADTPRVVPAPLVYLRYEYGDDEARIGGNASSGLAAGATLEEAILSGLYECIERDAFTISWLCRWPGRRIVIDDPAIAERMDRAFDARHPRVELAFFDITLDDVPIPVVMSYLVRPSEFGPTMSVGSASRMRPEDAVSKCLTEMGQFLPYARYLNARQPSWTPKDDFSNITTFDSHCMLYLRRPDLNDRALAPYRGAADQVALSTLPRYHQRMSVLECITECVSLLAKRGLEVVVVDITTPDVEDVGMKVVRVLVPGLANLHGNHTLPYLGCERLGQQLRALTANDPAATFNDLPHPFP